MTTFDNRDQAFENKYAHDEELAFKTMARRNKLLGQWAAAKLGKKGPQADQYAKDLILADFEAGGDIVEKLLKDFTQANISLSAQEIRAEMERLLPVARKQIMGEMQ